MNDERELVQPGIEIFDGSSNETTRVDASMELTLALREQALSTLAKERSALNELVDLNADEGLEYAQLCDLETSATRIASATRILIAVGDYLEDEDEDEE